MLRIAAIATVAFAVLAAPAQGSRGVMYGVQDDAWLAAGGGDLSTRLTELQRLGVDVYRFTLRWDQVERRDNSYDWAWPDSVIRGLRAHGIKPVVTIWGTPGWANGAPLLVMSGELAPAGWGRRTASTMTAAWMASTHTPAMNHGMMGPAPVRGRAAAPPVMAVPHDPQKRARDGFSAPQTGHCRVASLMRQS